jgi:hypothetical protein
MPRAAQMAIEVGGASKGKKSGESERVKEVSIATWATLPPQAAPHACQPGRPKRDTTTADLIMSQIWQELLHFLGSKL